MAAGIDSPESLWSFLLREADAAGPLPDGRWADYAEMSPEQATSLREATTTGSFMADVAGFDAGFFGISPREARLIDPQQRLVLEVAWEALEHAGIPPHSLADSDSGVFIGVGSNDYGRKLLEDTPRIEAWTGIGAALCGVANRISYTLDLHGASLATDTACSSSLVAIHEACNALRLGEIPLALAGGVLVMAGPGLTAVLDAAGAISPDGRSKPFDASADGYGRGEGVGVLVLKRLSAAQRAGDRVIAVIRGSAVSQDGRTDGIMAPSQEAQERLLRRVYARAGVAPDTVDYVEAHGTGTPVGDPVEAGALAAVLGQGRSADRPCLIGSIKSNVGHLEAAAGVAGVLKAVLAINHGVIPATRANDGPSPSIPWGDNGLVLTSRTTEWPRTDHPRRAGVASYGYGGTIAHVVIEEPPAVRSTSPGAEPSAASVPYPLSGATIEGLRANAARLADWLDTHQDSRLIDVGHTLALRRSHLPVRAVVTAAGVTELADRLRYLATDECRGDDAGVVIGDRDPELAGQDPVWVFSGHGAQWNGMGRELLTTEPAFGGVMQELEPVFTAEFGVDPWELLHADLDGTDRVQLAIFTVQVGLSAVWRAHGVRPGAVIGHSVGEIAAAVTAGALDLTDGARLACRRSALLREVAGHGAMAMVALPHREVATLLEGHDDVTAGVWAAPSSTVISGSPQTVAQLAERWKDEGQTVRTVNSDVAFHSPQMEPLAAALRAAVSDLRPRQPAIPLYSTALPDPRDLAPRDSAYWATNLRHPVRFADAVAAAAQDGHRVFLELAPHPVVAHSMEETLEAADVRPRLIVGTLRRDKPEMPTLLSNLGALHCGGANVDWPAIHGNGSLCDLPTTAFQHERYWVELVPPAPGGRGHVPETRTLLGGHSTVHGTSPARLWRTRLERANRPYPGDHPVAETEIVPAAVLLNTFFGAVHGDGEEAVALRDVALIVPVSVNQTRDVQVVLQDGLLRLSSRIVTDEEQTSAAAADDDWMTHTTAHTAPDLRDSVLSPDADRTDPDETCEPMPVSFVTDRLAELGVTAMGLPWHITDLRGAEGRLRAEVTAEPDATDPSWAEVLDAATSIASVSFPGDPVLRMPSHIDEAWVSGPPPEHVLIRVRPSGENDTVDVHIRDRDGTAAARLTGLSFGRPLGDLNAIRPADLLYRMDWLPYEQSGTPSRPGTLVLVGHDTEHDALTAALGEHAHAVENVAHPEDLAGLPGRLDPPYTVVLSGAGAARGSSSTEAAVHGVILFHQLVDALASWPSDDTTLWCLTIGAREAVTTAGLAQTPCGASAGSPRPSSPACGAASSTSHSTRVLPTSTGSHSSCSPVPLVRTFSPSTTARSEPRV
ncbi:type I polyketide synthase [Kibdelosporangium phytohabitans]|uniref:type I polyketide synthase n=1 Tax=Kibdelosporangium phytohabitans TaxID=860235 RepID=UPI0019FC3BF5|nr:type I polyketide synthase [Kibdelosporangium phytohabitans]MBE1461472.1 6-methylsalicylic acid synthase [Kibdelosporangium phytohabitans]